MCRILTESHWETHASMSFGSLEVVVRLSYKVFFFKLWLCPGVLQIISFATAFIKSRMGASRRNIGQAAFLSFFWVFHISR